MTRIFKNTVTVVVLLACSFVLTGTDSPTVDWMKFEEAAKASDARKRKIFIDIYTDWCGPCKMLDKYTFTDEHIMKVLSENYYSVKFNAEQKEDLVFRDRIFKLVHPNRVHDFAQAVTNNKLTGYPTMVILDEDFNILHVLSGYQKPQDLHKVIQFLGEDHYKQTKWDEWLKTYTSPY